MAGLGTIADIFNARYLALRFTAFIYLQDNMFGIILTSIDSVLFSKTQEKLHEGNVIVLF